MKLDYKIESVDRVLVLFDNGDAVSDEIGEIFVAKAVLGNGSGALVNVVHDDDVHRATIANAPGTLSFMFPEKIMKFVVGATITIDLPEQLS